jgi:Sulfotransferase family
MHCSQLAITNPATPAPVKPPPIVCDRTGVKLPNFFIVGAGKAGTTSLYHYFRTHPQIYMSPIKEPCYFAQDLDARQSMDSGPILRGETHEPLMWAPLTRWDDYLSLFKGVADEVVIGECSQPYLPSTRAAAEIAAVVPAARILIVLRDPIERAFSHYLMDLRNGEATGPFREEVMRDKTARYAVAMRHPYVEFSLYYEQVKRYFEVFPRDQVLVLLYKEYKLNTDAFVSEICRFLGVDDTVHWDATRKYNVAGIPRARLLNYALTQSGLKAFLLRVAPARSKPFFKRAFYHDRVPSLLAEDRERLKPIFIDDILKLQQLLGMDLSDWLV